MIKQLLQLTLFFVSVSVSYAYDAMPEGSPENVMKKYCEMDSLGHRCSSEHAAKIMELSTWIDGPGWDALTIIKSYQVSALSIAKNEAEIRVRYIVIGVLSKDANESWVLDKTDAGIKDEEYSLLNTEGRWKIDKPQIQPHISISTALTAMKKAGCGKTACEKLPVWQELVNLK